MILLSNIVKTDIALAAAALNSAGTGQYFSMRNYRKALFVVVIGAMVAAATAAVQIMQATSAAAGSATTIANAAATITANTKVNKATLTCASVIATDTVVVNGLTFTAVANGTNPTTIAGQRKFIVGTGGSANTDTATALAAILNDATLGVPGILASANGAVVTLTATEPGDNSITAAATGGTITVATVSALAYVEVDASFLDTANGFDHVAVRVTNSTSMETSAIIIRGDGRYGVDQHAAASKVDVSA